MAYHLSSEQYQRGLEVLARARLDGVTHGVTAAHVLGLVDMLAQLAGTSASKVMRDSDARLADLDSPLAPSAFE